MGLFKKIKKGIKKVAKVAVPAAAAYFGGPAGFQAANGMMNGGKSGGVSSLMNSFGGVGGGNGLSSMFSGGGFGGGGGYNLGSMFDSNSFGGTPGINPDFGSVNPMEGFGQGIAGGGSPSSSGGGIDWGNAFTSFLGGMNQGPQQRPTPQAQLMNPWSAGLGTLGTLYQGYKQGQNLSNQQKTLENLFTPNSPYAQQMRQTLERKDAAAGRRSQYGTREVELMGDLTAKRAGLAGQFNQIGQQQDQNRGRTIGGTLGYGNMSGAIPAAGQRIQDMYNQW
jgi:hypothetical protein